MVQEEAEPALGGDAGDGVVIEWTLLVAAFVLILAALAALADDLDARDARRRNGRRQR